MQRAHVCAGLGLGFMLAASSTYAGQANLSVETRLGGDSNVFRASTDRINDGTLDISPTFGIHDDDEDVRYGLNYTPTYRNFFKTSGIDGVDHNANARTSWMISPVDTIEAAGSYYNGRQFLFGSSGSGAGSTVSINDRERIRISDANLGYRRALSPRLSLRADGFFDDFDPSGTSVNSQTDSRAYTGRLSAEYVLTPRAVIGLSVSGRRRENRAVTAANIKTDIGRPSTRTDVWDVLPSLSYDITPTLSASIQVGPSFIRQQQLPAGARDPSSAACVTPPDFECDRYTKVENRTANLFASASITKKWAASDVSLSYYRSEARSGNVGSSSSINDDVRINWNQRISEHLTLRAIGTWDRFAQISSQSGSSGRFKINVVTTSETIEFTLSRRVLLIGGYTYVWQDQENNSSGLAGFSTDIDVDVHTGFVGLRYTFEPLAY